VLNTNRRERSVARNVGAAIAKGEYLHFLDDDDWLLPDALKEFWRLAKASEDAAWLYGGAQLIDVNNNQKLTLHLGLNGNCFAQTMAGEWIPLQASLIKTDFFTAVGGFNPLATPGEDSDLCRRVSLRGNLAYVPTTVAALLRGGESSTDYTLSLNASRREREKILSETGVFMRLYKSANSSYWHGRIVHIYLVSTVWNLQHGQIFTAISRLISGLASFVLVGRYLFVPEFWRAATTSHMSRILEE